MAKKKKKYRGSGTHGGGSKKKRRGAGSRGGRGRAGSNKHKKFKSLKEKDRVVSRKKGFNKPKKEVKTLNLKELDFLVDDLIAAGDVNKKDGKVEVDLNELGYDKLLGSGKVTRPLLVKSKNFTKKSKSKLEKSGGKAIEIS